MTLKVEVNYADSIPQTAVLGFAPRGVSGHWSAGGTGRAGALGTIRHFQTTRYTVNASYHLLVWWDAIAQMTGAMWIVRPEKASHSMNPANAYTPKTGSTVEKERFAEVRRILGVKASDPNAGCISISFCGMPADLAVALKSSEFVADMKRLIEDLKAIPSMLDRPLFGHGWIQPITRYDPGEALIPAIYLEPPIPEEDTLPALRPVRQQWNTGTGDTLAASVSTTPGGQFWTLGPDQGERKFFTAPEKVWTIAESADGRWRAVEYDREILWMHRYNLRPIAGTRNPASGFGVPSVGFTLAHVEEAEKAARNVGFVVGRDKAAAAAKAVTP